MCLILLAIDAHPRYRLVVAANRDEYYERPAKALSWWREHPQLLAGKDLESDGTWLGITSSGRFAALTNHRQPESHRPDAPSRGWLVKELLTSDVSPREYLGKVSRTMGAYNGFNLLVGRGPDLLYLSNRSDRGPTRLEAGLHGLSNHLLDTPWPKVTRGKRLLEKTLQEDTEEELMSRLLELLTDDWVPDDEELPDTGVGQGLERALAPIFISTPRYGTRCSQVVLVDRDGGVTCLEQTWQPGKQPQEPLRFTFDVTARAR